VLGTPRTVAELPSGDSKRVADYYVDALTDYRQVIAASRWRAQTPPS
jgi:hypothetical protein